MKTYGFYRCVLCREWFEASLMQSRLVGPVCYRCLNAQIDWDASEPSGVAVAGDPRPLDRVKRAAGDAQLPGLDL